MSKYNKDTEGNTIVKDLSAQVSNRTFLITGPSIDSLGAETALSLARSPSPPSTLLLLGRSLLKIQPVLDAIRTLNPKILTIFIPVDLASQSSVRAAAAQILADTRVHHIDVVINNAAIMACPHEQSEDGIELQLATNHLGHFLLTNLLLPKLLAAGPTPGARIICVSSWAHFMSPVDFEDPNFNSSRTSDISSATTQVTHPMSSASSSSSSSSSSSKREYSPWIAYGQAKTAIMLFAVELDRRLKSKGIHAFSLHPGSIKSGLQKHVNPDVLEEAQSIWKTLGKASPVMKTLQQGCATTLWAALDPGLEDEGGKYLLDCRVGEGEEDVAWFAVDGGNARRCWEMSEGLVGEKFEW